MVEADTQGASKNDRDSMGVAWGRIALGVSSDARIQESEGIVRRKERSRSRGGIRALTGTLLAVGTLVAACSDAGEPLAPAVPSVTGTVVSAATGDPVADAEVGIGDVTAVTGPDGRYDLGPLVAGPAMLRSTAPGFEAFEEAIEIPASRVYRNVALTRIELFEFGDFALYVPATVSETRGILIALGGPDTRGFASDSAFGAPVPEVEAALHALGRDFRSLAVELDLAVLGTSRAALPNGPDSDEALRQAVMQAATLSARPELTEIPLLVYGMSGGAPEAAGLTARNPERVAGLFLKVPESVERLADGPALGVPTYAVLAENDAFVDNTVLEEAFQENRAAGALWALALEPEVVHFSLTPAQRSLTIDWMRTILTQRIASRGAPDLLPIVASSGWLGDGISGNVYGWNSYPWDRAGASWLPTEASARTWGAFAKPNPSPPSRIVLTPQILNLEEGQLAEVAVQVWDGNDRPMYDVQFAFSSDDPDVATAGALRWDTYCLCLYQYVEVGAWGPGTAVITAELEGVTATTTVQVVPAAGEGLYDFEAIIEAADPAFWPDFEGYSYRGLLRLELDATNSGGIGGSYAGLRVVAPDGTVERVESVGGIVNGYYSDDFAGFGPYFYMELLGESYKMSLSPNLDPYAPIAGSLPARLEGSFSTPGQVYGTFSATLRSGE